jgi:hypothetical protein
MTPSATTEINMERNYTILIETKQNKIKKNQEMNFSFFLNPKIFLFYKYFSASLKRGVKKK